MEENVSLKKLKIDEEEDCEIEVEYVSSFVEKMKKGNMMFY